MPSQNELSLSHDTLLQHLRYDPETGEFWWKIRTSNRTDMNKPAGCFNKKLGYHVVRLNTILYYSHRLAWFYMTKEWPKDEIDHKNCNGFDNRFENLREATSSQQKMNRRPTSKSGFKGVTILSNGKYRSGLKFKNKGYWFGDFNTPEEANDAYKREAVKFFGEFMRGE